MTRAEQIRQMTDAELATMLCDLIWDAAGCTHCRFNSAVGCKVKEWLNEEDRPSDQS